MFNIRLCVDSYKVFSWTEQQVRTWIKQTKKISGKVVKGHLEEFV
jgi:hypothetical protein